MKALKGSCVYILLLSALLLIGNVNFFAQVRPDPAPGSNTPVNELRPFDFKDNFYLANGILPAMLVNRHNGIDGFSVRDRTAEENYSDVRIIATRPAYSGEGKLIYWSRYGELYRGGFADDAQGAAAYETAHAYPIYLFPSERRDDADRQAPIIDLGSSYFDENPLGLGVAMLVEYNPAAYQTKADAEFLAEMANINGRASDGTPIIRTVRELQQLQRRNLVNITTRDRRGQIPFIVGRVIRYPEHGGIAPDAFLLYTKDAKDKPLAGEIGFLQQFKCIQKYGAVCIVR